LTSTGASGFAAGFFGRSSISFAASGEADGERVQLLELLLLGIVEIVLAAGEIVEAEALGLFHREKKGEEKRGV
jgi:hypothetical protein